MESRPKTDAISTRSLPPAAGQPDFAARSIPLCGSGKRVTCVVDGDTLWLDGRKIRISNIDAPEMQARCGQERQKAEAATRKLQSLVSGKALQIDAEGDDRFGRLLARLSSQQGDVGDALVREGLAVRWTGHRADPAIWCG